MSLTSVIEAITKKKGDSDKKRRSARKQLKEYAIELSKGTKPDYSKIERLLEDAEADHSDFSKFLSNLDKRIEGKKEYESFDYEAERSKLKEERANATKELEVAKQTISNATKEAQGLHETLRRISRGFDQLRNQDTQSTQNWERTLAMTGGGEDWDDIEFRP